MSCLKKCFSFIGCRHLIQLFTYFTGCLRIFLLALGVPWHSNTALEETAYQTMMTSLNGNIFRVTGSLCEESTGHRWIPVTKASDAELWCFLWSPPEQTAEQTIEMSVMWDAITFIMTSLLVPFHKSQDTLLHPGLNDQIQNTLFTEDPHETRALWGWFDWLPGSACADLRWSAISASTRYPRLNPLWLVTHCTLSHAHHSFQSHMHHLACMEMAKFLCAIFNWLKLFYCNGVTSPKPLS